MVKRSGSEMYDAAKLRIPKEWRKPLEEIIKKEGYASLAELARDLLRQKLREYGYLK